MSLVMATVNVVLWLAAPGSLGDLGQWQVFYFHRLTVSYAIFLQHLVEFAVNNMFQVSPPNFRMITAAGG